MNTFHLYHPITRAPITVDRRTEAAFLVKGYTRSANAPKASAGPSPGGKPTQFAPSSTSTPPAVIDVSDPAAAIAGAKGKAELFAVAKALGTRVPDEVTKAPEIRAFLLEAHKPVEPPPADESDASTADGDGASDDSGDLI